MSLARKLTTFEVRINVLHSFPLHGNWNGDKIDHYIMSNIVAEGGFGGWGEGRSSGDLYRICRFSLSWTEIQISTVQICTCTRGGELILVLTGDA